jgi:sorting nexin-4
MDSDSFDNVTWQNEPDLPGSSINPEDGQPGTSRVGGSSDPPQAGNDADAVDVAGVGEGRLECTVGSPVKEGDGTKDAYVSYLVTTRVWPIAKASDQG